MEDRRLDDKRDFTQSAVFQKPKSDDPNITFYRN